MLSQYLRLRVQEAGQERVNLTFKAALAERLADLLPPGLEEKLQARGLDVHRISAEAAESGFAPGELFQLSEGTKQIRVWLE